MNSHTELSESLLWKGHTFLVVKRNDGLLPRICLGGAMVDMLVMLGVFMGATSCVDMILVAGLRVALQKHEQHCNDRLKSLISLESPWWL